jgi:hypothetical protein
MRPSREAHTRGVQNARSYAVPGAPDVDRSTARGEQQFRLAQRLLPLEERRAEASRVRARGLERVSAARARASTNPRAGRLSPRLLTPTRRRPGPRSPWPAPAPRR